MRTSGDDIARIRSAVLAIGVSQGLTHTEIKLTPAGPRIIEVNGRLGGNLDELYRRAHGVDLLSLGLDVAGDEEHDFRIQDTDKIFYQYSNMAPIDGGTFVSVEGLNAIRGANGIAAYRLLVASGSELPAGVMTTRIDLLTGCADNHSLMLDGIDRALAQVTFTIADRRGRTRVWRPSRSGMICID